MGEINPKRLEKIEKAVANRQPDLTIVLENIYDLHNMGAVMRSAESIGIIELYVLFTHEHLKKDKIKLGKNTSSGARKWLDVHLFNDAAACFEAVRKNYKTIVGAYLDQSATGLYDLDLTQSTAIVIGNEHEGITEETLAFCDERFSIPQFGMTQSLNLSVACGVTLYEAARQRLQAGYYKNHPTWNQEKQGELLENYLERHSSGYCGFTAKERKV